MPDALLAPRAAPLSTMCTAGGSALNYVGYLTDGGNASACAVNKERCGPTPHHRRA